MEPRSLLPDHHPIAIVDADHRSAHPSLPIAATRDHQLIRDWAVRRHAEPATGEASESGPPTVTVNDDGTGIRFNFPGLGRFRPISWEEWFKNFDTYEMAFIFERDESGSASGNRYRLMPIDALRRVAKVIDAAGHVS